MKNAWICIFQQGFFPKIQNLPKFNLETGGFVCIICNPPLGYAPSMRAYAQDACMTATLPIPALLPTYAPYPFPLVRGEGDRVFDDQGQA